jgi:hypothetical protein
MGKQQDEASAENDGPTRGRFGARAYVNYPDARDLVPIVIICAVPILLSVLWLICVWQ